MGDEKRGIKGKFLAVDAGRKGCCTDPAPTVGDNFMLPCHRTRRIFCGKGRERLARNSRNAVAGSRGLGRFIGVDGPDGPERRAVSVGPCRNRSELPAFRRNAALPRNENFQSHPPAPTFPQLRPACFWKKERSGITPCCGLWGGTISHIGDETSSTP